MNGIERSASERILCWLNSSSNLNRLLSERLSSPVRSVSLQELPTLQRSEFLYGSQTEGAQSYPTGIFSEVFGFFVRAWRVCEQWYAGTPLQQEHGAASTFEVNAPLGEVLPWKELIDTSAVRHGVDPALIAAIISRESGGKNLIGDYGHGRGLMQIDDRWHRAFLDSNRDGLEPSANIDYGTKLLRANLDRFDGDVRAAVAAYNAGVGAVQRALGQGQDVDRVTTGGNYSSDILARAEAMRDLFSD